MKKQNYYERVVKQARILKQDPVIKDWIKSKKLSKHKSFTMMASLLSGQVSPKFISLGKNRPDSAPKK